MKLIRTAKIKLNIPVSEVLPTMQAYTTAFNRVCQVGFEEKDKNGVSLHKKTYKETREYLPSQLAISSRMKATEALISVFKKTKHKKYGSQPKSKLCSIRYDERSYSIFLDKKEVSLLTIVGRKRCSFEIPIYYQELFSIWKYGSADLVVRKNSVYLHISFSKEINDIQPTNNFVGIDRGINNLAVSSNNQFFGGGIIKKQVRKYQRLRSSLQSRGTKSAKRHLVRLRKREQRFRADINHNISKQIIESMNSGDTLVLEDLTGIRAKRLRKKQRTLLNNWSFFQLEQFLIYKGAAKGIKVMYVDARYTSQRCCRCCFIARSNRKEHSFCCKQCGFKLNADLNGSRNIVAKHLASYILAGRAAVNQPIVALPLVAAASQQPCAGGN